MLIATRAWMGFLLLVAAAMPVAWALGWLQPLGSIGTSASDSDDHEVGTVDHVHGTGIEGYVIIIDVGGFLGTDAKPVAVNAGQLDFVRDENGEVHAVAPFTEDQLRALPEHHDMP